MTKIIEILSPDEVRRTLTRVASQIVGKSGHPSELVLLGIHSRGVPLAQMLADQIGVLEQVKEAWALWILRFTEMTWIELRCGHRLKQKFLSI